MRHLALRMYITVQWLHNRRGLHTDIHMRSLIFWAEIGETCTAILNLCEKSVTFLDETVLDCNSFSSKYNTQVQVQYDLLP